MVSKLSWTALALALAGCVPMSGYTGNEQQAAAGPPACQESRFPMTVDGKPAEAQARSCLLPDGGLEVTQQTPGLPEQVYRLPTPSDAAPPQTSAAGCRDYNVAVIVAGESRQATRQAC